MRARASLLTFAAVCAAASTLAWGNATVSDFDTGTYYGGQDGWFGYGSKLIAIVGAPAGSGADTSNWLMNNPNQYWGQFTNQDWANPNLPVSAFPENSNLEFDIIFPGTGPNAWVTSYTNQAVDVEFQFLDSTNTVNLFTQTLTATVDASVKDQAMHVILDYSSIKPGIDFTQAMHYNLSMNIRPGYDWSWDTGGNPSATPFPTTAGDGPMVYVDNIVLTPTLLTWNNSGGAGDGTTWDANQVNFNDGTNPIAYNDGSVIGVPNGNAVAFTDANNGNYTVNLTGNLNPRSVTITTANTYTFTGTGNIGAPATVVDINGTGSVTLSAGVGMPGVVNLASGKLLIQGNATASPVAMSMESLTIGSGAKTVLQASSGAPNVLTIKSLTVANDGSAWMGGIDLGNNALVLQADGTNNGSVLANAQDMAMNTSGGTAGIISASTAADPTHKLVVVVDNYLLGLTTFNGTAVDANSILVEATYYGDSNLDRKVDVTDLGTLATNYGKSVPNGMLQGDFNGDGKVDVTDLGLLATDYGLGTSGGSFSATPVPEPASLALAVLAGMGLLMRRRR